MAGPYEIVARDGEHRRTKGGSERDMYTAWQMAQAGDAEQALKIINAYAQTLQGFDGHDAPLCSIQAYWLLRAMIILKDSQTPEWTAMIERAMRPFRFRGAKGTDYLSIQNTGTSGNICWVVDAGGTINFAGSAEPKDYPFELIPYEEGMGMTPILPAELAETRYYSLNGARIDEPASGIFIRCRIWTDGTVVTDRILMK